MKRNRKKQEKVRVCINLDKDLIEQVDEYISNLSGFFNKSLRNYIEVQKLKESGENVDNIRYVKSNRQKKSTNSVLTEEPIDLNFKWW